MKNSILELYYGNIDAQAGQTVITTELRNNLKVLSNKEEQLRSTLSGDTLKLFEEYVYIKAPNSICIFVGDPSVFYKTCRVVV